MKIGIFSDIHNNIVNLEKTKEIFIQEKIELVLFCGDLVSPFTLKFLTNWPWQIKAVFGNNEGDKWGIIRRFTKYTIKNIEYPQNGIFWEFDFDQQKIAVFHGNSKEIVENSLKSGKYNLFCSGHDHEPKIKQIGKTLWVNPGSVTGVAENPEIKIGSVAIYDNHKKQTKIVQIK